MLIAKEDGHRLMGGFDSFLSVALPAGILIFIVVKIYNKLSVDNPNWFTHLREWISEKTASTSTKIDPMKQGSIQYAT